MKSPALIFRALSDDTRLLMLALLQRHDELCVCDLEHVLEISQSKASRHLRYLLNASLVKDRRAAVWIYYKISDELSSEQSALLSNAIALLEDVQLQTFNRRLTDWRLQKNCGVVRNENGEPIVPSESTANA
jgi:ArsR family transcriptional regulator, arsenate/arsenite/antimonite-responsive transcriptional repressor